MLNDERSFSARPMPNVETEGAAPAETSPSGKASFVGLLLHVVSLEAVTG